MTPSNSQTVGVAVGDIELTQCVAGKLEAADEVASVDADVTVSFVRDGFHDDGRLSLSVEATVSELSQDTTASLRKVIGPEQHPVYMAYFSDSPDAPEFDEGSLRSEFPDLNLYIDGLAATELTSLVDDAIDLARYERSRIQSKRGMQLIVDQKWDDTSGFAYTAHATGAVLFDDGCKLPMRWEYGGDIGHTVTVDSDGEYPRRQFDDSELDAAIALAQTENPLPDAPQSTFSDWQ